MTKLATSENAQPKRKRYWWLLFLLIGGSIFFWYWINEKSEGIIMKSGIANQQTLSQGEVKARYEGKYMVFSYPSRYQSRFFQKVNFPVLEQMLLMTTDLEGRKISVIAQDITGYSLEEYSSFRIRFQDSNTYQKEKVFLGNKAYWLFTKSSSVFEVGAFTQEGDTVLSFVISSPLKIEGLREELLDILESRG